MAAIANGLAAYLPQSANHRSGFIPVISTFFMFTLYAAPALRMAALQKLRTITVATHDSLAIGEDGPTHQPIALASFFRALPGLHLWRPADAEETIAAWQYAIEGDVGPTVLCLSRQPVPLLDGSSRSKAVLGAYTVVEATAPAVVLLATGSEVSIAVNAAKVLADKFKITARVVSMPCQEIFDKQPASYRREVLGGGSALVVAVEAWSSYGWARYAHASISMHSFGESGPHDALYEMFGFSFDNVATKVSEFVQQNTDANGSVTLPGVGEFQELLLGFVKH